jgi:demethylmenaquinone methyltransferase/2-methoxy-6-polyprenyl-1,4-benzoquinol methylase
MTFSAQNSAVAREPTPLYVRLLAGLVRPFPNFDFGFIKPVRQKAADLLRLSVGDSVLDVGCGSGGAFPSLVQAVGTAGKVVGVEISPASAAHARRRVLANKWNNAEIVLASAQESRLNGHYDALLMFAAPDVYASKEALAQLTPHLRHGARVVLFGGKTSKHRFGWLLNSALNFAMTKLSLPTTPGLEAEPWRIAEKYFEELVIEELFFGWMFIAAGTFRDSPRNDA